MRAIRRKTLPSDEGHYKCKCTHLLEEGGGGSVYLARALHPDYYWQKVALKIPHIETVPGRFQYETQLLHTVRHHNVVEILWFDPRIDYKPEKFAEIWRNSNLPRPFYVMPYADSGNLVHWMRRNWRKAHIKEVLGFLSQLCDGCLAIFAQTEREMKVRALRDLKPQNLLVGEQDCILIADLGTTKTQRAQTLGLEGIGTLGWSAPECVNMEGDSSKATERSDSYSIARIAAWLLTYSRLPKSVRRLSKEGFDKWFTDYDTHKIKVELEEICKGNTYLRTELKELQSLIVKALDNDQGKRPGIEELKSEFQRISEQVKHKMEARSTFRRFAAKVYEAREKLILSLGAAAISIAGLITIFAFLNSPDPLPPLEPEMIKPEAAVIEHSTPGGAILKSEDTSTSAGNTQVRIERKAMKEPEPTEVKPGEEASGSIPHWSLTIRDVDMDLFGAVEVTWEEGGETVVCEAVEKSDQHLVFSIPLHVTTVQLDTDKYEPIPIIKSMDEVNASNEHSLKKLLLGDGDLAKSPGKELN